jgi:predicted amidohydrolase YtcJ
MSNHADLILTAPTIHTFDPVRPHAEAIAIRDGHIIGVGSIAELAALAGPETERRSHDGTVIPGLTDAHTHVVMGAAWTRGINLTDLDLASVREALRYEAAVQPGGEWIMGWGLDPNVFEHGFDGRIFDEATAGHPMFLRMRDGHSAVCNTAALELAGITGTEVFPDESALGVDADGTPTGYLLEFSAMDLVLAHCPAESVVQQAGRLLKVLQDMAATGITSTHVLDMEGNAEEVVACIEETSELPVRLRFSPMIKPGTTEADWQEHAGHQGKGGRRWSIGGVKFMIDGTIDNGSAWLAHPDIFGQGVKSIWSNTEDYKRALRFFSERSISTATHAIGDRGVDFVLDALEELGEIRALAAHRIEHIETIPDETVLRFAQLNVAASMQPIHGTHHTKADRSDNWSKRLGTERAERGWRCRDLRNSGATLALGSDWPITPYDPREMMADSVLRRPVRKPEVEPVQPEQGLTVLMALEGYTVHAARSANLEDVTGSITVGKYADLTILDTDPLTVDGEQLADLEVEATYVAGTRAHSEERVASRA